MKVLIACEYSGISRRAFEVLGHEVISADFEPSEDGATNHHQGDVFDLIEKQHFDLMIAHPPCTYFTAAAAWALQDANFDKYPGVGYHQKIKAGTLVGAARREAQKQALDFVLRLMDAPIKMKAIENPVGQLSTLYRKPDQTIHPWWFGDDASKSTCLWLENLPMLRKTKEVRGRIVNGKERWGNQTDSGQNKLSPSVDRWKERSRTYPGIGEAWATQWGVLTQNTAHKKPATPLWGAT